MAWNLNELSKSDSDVCLGGVCGGLGEHTPVPSWIYRSVFTLGAFAFGATLLVYLVLWIFMPEPKKASERG